MTTSWTTTYQNERKQKRSNLFPDNNIFTVHGENLDPVRVWPELDELRRAKNEEKESIYARK